MPRYKCFNPFKKDRHVVVDKNNVRPVSKEIIEIFSIDANNFICTTCRLKVNQELKSPIPKEIQDSSNSIENVFEESIQEEFCEPDDLDKDVSENNIICDFEREKDIEKLNEILLMLNISPIVSSTDLRTQSAQKKKVREIREVFENKLKKVFKYVEAEDEKNDFNGLIDEIKEELKKNPSKSRKIEILTMVPKTWSIPQMTTEFEVPYSLAQKAAQLHAENGIGSSPNPRLGKKLPEEIVKIVRDFYYDSDISRQLPGIKDSKSVIQIDNSRKKLQKRLILGNLKEIYATFKLQFPNVKIGFSTFVKLRPQECIFAGASGTHSICVCKIHENTKLLIDAANIKELRG